MFSKIMIATDGSERAERAAEHAFVLAKACNAELQVVSVTNTSSPREAYEIDPDFHEETEEMTNVNVDELKEKRSRPEREIVDKVLKLAAEKGIRASGHVAAGDPAEEILKFAEESGTGLIVLGSHGRGALASAVMGSVCAKVVRSGETPVLVVPARKDKK